MAAEALQRSMALLDNERIHRRVHEQIERAVATFAYRQRQPASHDAFHKRVTLFVRHVYELGFSPPHLLSAAQAGDEAIALLQASYDGTRSGGYDAALRTGVDPPHNGIEFVLARMGEIIHEQRQRIYKRWVFSTCIESLSWSDRCRAAELLLRRLRPFLSPQLQRCSGDQLADEIPALLDAHLESDAQLRHMAGGIASLRSR